MKNLKIIVAASAVSVLTAIAALAHSGATGIYKERMDGMMAMGKVVKSLSSMMRGEIAYDAALVRQGAQVIKFHAGETMTTLFPEGTTEAPSEARPEIWSDWDTFEALAKQLETYAKGLDSAAENGLAMGGENQSSMMENGNSMMMGNQSGMMGDSSSMMGNAQTTMTADQLAKMPVDGVFNMIAQTCSSCHTKFRLEKK